MLYFKNTVPVQIQNLFIETCKIHKYNTRSAKSGNCFTQRSRLELKAFSFSKSGTDIWNSLPVELRKKNKIRFKKDLKIQLSEIITGLPSYHFTLNLAS